MSVQNAGPNEARFLAVLAPPDFTRVAAGWREARAPGVLDVRSVPPAQRQDRVFEALDELAVGASLTLVSDHDPIPLRYQLEATRGGAFAWDYEERGPDAWRVRVGRQA